LRICIRLRRVKGKGGSGAAEEIAKGAESISIALLSSRIQVSI